MAQAPHAPTDDTRRKVDSLAGLGITQDIIAKMVGITKPTLRKHYREILDVAQHRANAMLAESAFMQAVGRPAVYDQQGRLIRAEMAPVPSVTIFMAKVRLGYKEPAVPKSQDDREIRIIVEGGLPRKPTG